MWHGSQTQNSHKKPKGYVGGRVRDYLRIQKESKIMHFTELGDLLVRKEKLSDYKGNKLPL